MESTPRFEKGNKADFSCDFEKSESYLVLPHHSPELLTNVQLLSDHNGLALFQGENEVGEMVTVELMVAPGLEPEVLRVRVEDEVVYEITTH